VVLIPGSELAQRIEKQAIVLASGQYVGTPRSANCQRADRAVPSFLALSKSPEPAAIRAARDKAL